MPSCLSRESTRISSQKKGEVFKGTNLLGSGANKHYENMGADGYKIRPYWLTDKYKDDIMKHPNDY